MTAAAMKVAPAKAPMQLVQNRKSMASVINLDRDSISSVHGPNENHSPSLTLSISPQLTFCSTKHHSSFVPAHFLQYPPKSDWVMRGNALPLQSHDVTVSNLGFAWH